MKIICIEGNYNADERSSSPVFTIKPETCLLRNNHPFFIPDHSLQISPRLHLVLKISRLGKNIQEKFAHLYYNEIGIGVDMVATGTLKACRNAGLPWEQAKAFDASSPLGNFISAAPLKENKNIPFSLMVNEKIIANPISSEMIFSFSKIIEHVSKYVTLKMGDLIYTGSKENSYSVTINDRIEAFIGEKKLLWFHVK